MKRKRGVTQVGSADTTVTNHTEANPPKKRPITDHCSKFTDDFNYGSREYWENRYKRNWELVPQCNKDGAASSGNVQDNKAKMRTSSESENKGDPSFAWYFSYSELRSLLLPLVVGRGDEWSNIQDETGDEWLDIEEEEKNLTENQSIGSSDDKNGTNDNHSVVCNKDSVQEVEDPISSKFTSGCNSNATPKNILEIGCGDVPLGEELCYDLLGLEKETCASSNLIVKTIVCTDYSECVIEIMLKRQKKIRERVCEEDFKGEGEAYTSFENHKNDSNEEQEVLDSHPSSAVADMKLNVHYEVQDARKLPYNNETFDLIIDKGTLDAMLSDKKHGMENCIRIIKEASRVMSSSGYLFIVSQMNVNDHSRMSWIDDVVVEGLKSEEGTSNWIVEVHSADAHDEGNPIVETGLKCDLDSEAEVTHSSFHPAVYIIWKTNASTEAQVDDNDSIPRVEIRYFDY